MEATLRHVARIMLAGSTTSARQHNADLLDVLFGLRSPSRLEFAMLNKQRDSDASSTESDIQGIQWFDATLNDSQKRAVEFTLRANEVACIHGPPGVSSDYGTVCRI
jgi:DNA polymerase alpha-associated DNA helicase A